MKKIYLPFTFVVCMIGMLACGPSKKELAERARQDSIRRVDSIAAVARAAAEQARLDSIREDSLRRDSIREDSIAQEAKMRIDPTIFIGENYRSKLRNQYGFKVVVDRKFKNYDIDFGDGEWMDDYEYKYTRTFHGRRIEFNEWGSTCAGASLTFYSKIDKDNFIEDLKKAGYRKTEWGWENPKRYHHVSFEGNTAHVIDCG